MQHAGAQRIVTATGARRARISAPAAAWKHTQHTDGTDTPASATCRHARRPGQPPGSSISGHTPGILLSTSAAPATGGPAAQLVPRHIHCHRRGNRHELPCAAHWSAPWPVRCDEAAWGQLAAGATGAQQARLEQVQRASAAAFRPVAGDVLYGTWSWAAGHRWWVDRGKLEVAFSRLAEMQVDWLPKMIAAAQTIWPIEPACGWGWRPGWSARWGCRWPPAVRQPLACMLQRRHSVPCAGMCASSAGAVRCHQWVLDAPLNGLSSSASVSVERPGAPRDWAALPTRPG